MQILAQVPFQMRISKILVFFVIDAICQQFGKQNTCKRNGKEELLMSLNKLKLQIDMM